MKLYQIPLIFICAASPSLIAGEIVDAKIVEIRSRVNDSLIRFDKKFTERCSDGGTWGQFIATDTPKSKQTWSILLSAAAAGKKVKVTGTCGYHTSIKEVFVYY
jgi:NAD(P)H-flavin reductase